MSLQTGTVEITGLSVELLKEIDQRAGAAGHTVEDYLRALIEQQHVRLDFSPDEVVVLRQELQAARDQIDRGNFYAYPSVDAMMDDIEAEIENRSRQRKNGGSQ